MIGSRVMRSMRVLCVAALGAGVIALAGCDSIREEAGLSKQSPDEFAVTTKAPLIIPPDFNLRPQKLWKRCRRVGIGRAPGG